jgi:5-methylcytosine-specific restriction endonuclease McrBC GTP-binding regulatory subunit McrB
MRFRAQAFLQAYLTCEQQFGDNMPVLAENMQNLNQRINSNTMVTYTRDFNLGAAGNNIAPVNQARHRIISGCPGSGKSHYLDDGLNFLPNAKKIKTSFHQESTYFDFVGTYKPAPLYEKNTEIVTATGSPFPLGKPVINYAYVIGPLIEAYLYAIKNPAWNIVLVIDEVNRGNVGVIFGDFFQLLDREPANQFESKYSIQPNADLLEFLQGIDFVKTRLAGTQNHIKLPGNLFIWATMNSADQGVFPLDSAFRRRWEFEYKGYNEPCAYGAEPIRYNNAIITWDDFRKAINEKLLKDLNVPEDKLIGPYFLTQEEISKPEKVLNKLFLYLWDDVVRFQQKQIMDYDSFADLKTSWNNGNGKIFNFI